MNYLNKIRIENPLTICYTNDVVKNFTANGLLSIGASPAMSEAPEEAEEFYKVAQALLINIGTLTAQNEQDIIAIAQTANEAGLPIVFDPVAVGASTYRKQFCKLLLKSTKVSVIKGNASEILALIDDTATMKGTDSDANLDAVAIAKKAYAIFKTAIVITGEEDVIVQGDKAIVLANGSPLLARVTGAGCLLGGVIAGFLFRETEPDIEALIEAVSVFNIAAEVAAENENCGGPGTFSPLLLDTLYKQPINNGFAFKRWNNMFNQSYLNVYFICGTSDVPSHRTIHEVLEAALKAGITLFQFREKGESALKGNDKLVLAKELQHLCHQYDVPFIVNDEVSLAKEINADGIHVGQDDAKVKEIAQYFTDKIIGLSISDLDEYAKSDLTHVDYIGVGPIYPTPSKHDAHTPVGPEMIATFKEMNPQLPIVAIGGINTSNVAPIVEAGANGISVISAISKSENIEKTVNRFKDFFNN
ncbi:TPA: thiamine phosphate synthase [Staphylococcus aureus]|nr:thiamine phosphate synthase [Staphylococcus aureus]